MNENDMTLGTDWNGQTVDGWFASEKLDGVRLFWDGASLWTRGGKRVDAPASFTASLPRGIRLDGECFAGYGQFNIAKATVQHGSNWPACRFVAFDAPDAAGNYLERVASIPDAVARVPVFTVESEDAMRAAFRKVFCSGGEGLVLRDPSVTSYITGRTETFLKFKG